MHLEVGRVAESFAALVAGVNQRVLKQNNSLLQIKEVTISADMYCGK